MPARLDIDPKATESEIWARIGTLATELAETVFDLAKSHLERRLDGKSLLNAAHPAADRSVQLEPQHLGALEGLINRLEMAKDSYVGCLGIMTGKLEKMSGTEAPNAAERAANAQVPVSLLARLDEVVTAIECQNVRFDGLLKHMGDLI